MTRRWQIFEAAASAASSVAGSGLLTGSCVGALKVPAEVADNTGSFLSRGAEI